MENNLKLSPPWVTYVSELKALFGEDPDIRIEYRDDTYEVKLFVDGADKADALSELLPAQRVYGNVVFSTTVAPANGLETGTAGLIEKAFKGNPALSDIMCVPTPFGEMQYVMFRKKVVQYYNDELCDPHGNVSTLYEDIARDVFGDSDVFFCTDVKDE